MRVKLVAAVLNGLGFRLHYRFGKFSFVNPSARRRSLSAIL
jgi:hypothetical protein